ncbi:hypothetical protein FQA39_LY18822 [Lamprigera yunnana]|nr:hypothetical protein FQA39_LY18822 [Lamprigera yunnana]
MTTHRLPHQALPCNPAWPGGDGLRTPRTGASGHRPTRIQPLHHRLIKFKPGNSTPARRPLTEQDLTPAHAPGNNASRLWDPATEAKDNVALPLKAYCPKAWHREFGLTQGHDPRTKQQIHTDTLYAAISTPPSHAIPLTTERKLGSEIRDAQITLAASTTPQVLHLPAMRSTPPKLRDPLPRKDNRPSLGLTCQPEMAQLPRKTWRQTQTHPSCPTFAGLPFTPLALLNASNELHDYLRSVAEAIHATQSSTSVKQPAPAETKGWQMQNCGQRLQQKNKPAISLIQKRMGAQPHPQSNERNSMRSLHLPRPLPKPKRKPKADTTSFPIALLGQSHLLQKHELEQN